METGLSYPVYNPWDGTRNLRSRESKSGVSQYWDQQASLYDTHERLRHIAIELLQFADISRGLKVIDIGFGNAVRHHPPLIGSLINLKCNATATRTMG